MKEESPDELVCREGHGLLLVVVAIVPPGEFHFTAFDIDDPMIGDGDAVRVAANVIHHLLWSGEGRFSVDDPFQVAHRIQMTLESLRVSQGLKRSEEPQLARVKGLLQILQEQSAEQAGQYPHGQEEARAAEDPPSTIGRESAARDDTLEMGMKKHVLTANMDDRK